MKHALHLGLAVLLAASAACDSKSNPLSPSAAGLGTVSAVPEGTPTLKASTPGSPQPSQGSTTELGPQNTIPVTLSVSNAVATHATGVTLSHRFQLLKDGQVLAEPLVSAGSGGRTAWVVTTQLEFDTEYQWRARAELNDAYGAWSPTWTFRTPEAPKSGARRTPDPPPGQRLPLPDRYGVVVQAFSERPDLVRRSCQEHGGTWEFMDYLVDKLREEDNRWGYNLKRGGGQGYSMDVVDYHWGAGPSEGSTQVYIIDIMLQHCGNSPAPAWVDQTDITYRSGTVGRWTGRGRFTN